VSPLADHEEETRNLKLVLCGATPLDEGIRREAERKLGAPVRQGYGLTEAGGTHQTFDGDLETDPASVGVLSPGTEARIVEPGSTRDAAVGSCSFAARGHERLPRRRRGHATGLHGRMAAHRRSRACPQRPVTRSRPRNWNRCCAGILR
jgi:acyl-CoA synthetase (AMP-forming)/AMP-acid ligase II